MIDAPLGDARSPQPAPFSLAPAQVAYFEAFGFLHLPGLFLTDIDRIVSGFEQAFAETPAATTVEDLDRDGAVDAFSTAERVDTYHHLHRGRHRAIIPDIVDRSPDLQWLTEDARILGMAESILGPAFEYRGSDGNLLDCDTSWHCDVYNAPIEDYHLKVLFYLDPLDRDGGALRVMPGTHHHQSGFAQQMQRDLNDWEAIPRILGVDCDEIPCWTVPTQPGDAVAINFRTMHATFHGADRRRLFTMNYRGTGWAGPGAS